MPPIEGVPELIRDIGAEELAGSISLRARVEEIDGKVVQAAFQLPKVDLENLGEVKVEGYPSFPVLAIVTHEFKISDPGHRRMMDWIPQAKLAIGGRGSDGEILEAFGVARLENFEYLGGKFHLGSIPPTRMRLEENLGEEWIFEGYDRRDEKSFSHLKETLWAVAMLPCWVLEKALDKRHFLLMSEKIGNGEGVKKRNIASITRGGPANLY